MMDTQKHRTSGDAEFCSVCGDQVAGKYFGAYVCMPCKIFFLRNHDKGDVLSCSGIASNGMCIINKSTRTNCSSCRYKKCVHVGMAKKERPEVVEPLHGQKLCMVCSDIANGIHFGVVSCEGCKKFFRRSMGEQDKYKCRGQKQCSINPRSRNTCRFCRYQKCLQVGMSPEVGSKKDHTSPNSEWKRKAPKESPSVFSKEGINGAACNPVTNLTSITTLPSFPTGSCNSLNLPTQRSSPCSWPDTPVAPTLSQSQMQHLAMMSLSHNMERQGSLQSSPTFQIKSEICEKYVDNGEKLQLTAQQHLQNKSTINALSSVNHDKRGIFSSSGPQYVDTSSESTDHQRDRVAPGSRTAAPSHNGGGTVSNRFNGSHQCGHDASAYQFDCAEDILPKEKRSNKHLILYENNGSISPASSVSSTELQMCNDSQPSPLPEYQNKRKYSHSGQHDYKSDNEFNCMSPSKVLKVESPIQTSCQYSDKTLADIAGNIMINAEEMKKVYAPIMKECLSIYKPSEFTKTVIHKTVSWMQGHVKGDPTWLLGLLHTDKLGDFECGFNILDDLLKYFTVDNHPKELEDINSFFTDLYKMVIIDVECSSLPEHEKIVHSKMLINLNGVKGNGFSGASSASPILNPTCETSPPKASNTKSTDFQLKQLMDLVKKYSSASKSDKLDILWGICPSFYKSKYWLQPTFPTENRVLTDQCKLIIRAVARSLQQYTFSFIWDRLMLYQQYSGNKKSADDYGRNDVYKFLMEYLDKQATSMSGFVSDLPDWKKMKNEDQLTILYKMMPLRIMCMCMYMFLPNSQDGKMLHPICWNWYNWPWMEFIQAFSDMAEEQLAQDIDLIEGSLTLVLAGIAADTNSISDPDEVEKTRQPFLEALIAYLQKKHGSSWKEVLKNLYKFVPKMRVLYAWFGAIWQNIILSISQ